MSKPDLSVTHLMMPRGGISFCRTIINSLKMKYTYEIAKTTCPKCIQAWSKNRPVRK